MFEKICDRARTIKMTDVTYENTIDNEEFMREIMQSIPEAHMNKHAQKSLDKQIRFMIVKQVKHHFAANDFS